MATTIRKTMDANWKTCIEAFLESFHVPQLHAQALPFGGNSSVQYDVWPNDRHAIRFLDPLGVSGDQCREIFTEQQILQKAMDARSAGEAPALLGDMKARHFLAETTRVMMSEVDGVDYSGLSDSEAIDAIQYSLFPNFVVFRSLGYPYAYRFLPVKGNPDRCVFDFLIFKPKTADQVEFPEPELVEIGQDGSYHNCGALPPWLGEVYDQDTIGLAQCQEGIRDGGDADIIYSSYQEVRIRHLHQTLAYYLALGDKTKPVN